MAAALASAHLAGSLARQYPVSHRAITLELFGQGPQGLVDAAEQSSWALAHTTLPLKKKSTGISNT